jgi:methylisocitrate lyase
MALYPLSAFRAMSKAAEIVYTTIRQQGTQREALPLMQTREELYQTLRYHEYEEKLDQFLQKYSGKAR